LPFQRLRVVDLDDTGRNGKQLGKLGGTVASGSGDDLEALVIGSHGDGLDEAVVLDGLGIMLRWPLCGRCGSEPHG
jgi:hypothetical protein